jgi:NAD(P)-dependent dehydrogenase (short-subunit alcohol dehydrogenase family)
MSPVTTPRVPAGVYDGNGESSRLVPGRTGGCARVTGTIVTISSVNAFLPDPTVIGYSAAKAALTNFATSLSTEVGHAGYG